MANPLVSQLKVDNVTYDIKDSYLRDLLLTDVVDEKSTYIFRKTGGDKNFEIGDRNKEFINEIIGGSLVVNQLLENGNFESASGWLPVGGTLSVTNNIATFIKSQGNPSYFGKYVTLLPNHVYLGIGTLRSAYTYIALTNVNTNANYAKSDESVISDSYFKTVTFLYKNAEGISSCMFDVRNGGIGGTDRQIQAQKVMLIDLTRFLGSSTIADYIFNLGQTNGLAWLYEYFPILDGGYIPYNTGKIESICISKHITTKLNQYNPNSEKYIAGAYGIMNMPIGKTNKLYMTLQDKDTSIDVSDMYFGFVALNNALDKGVPLSTDECRWVKTPQGIQSNHSNTSGGLSTADGPYLLDGLIIYPPDWDRLNARYDICISIDSDRNGEYEPFQESIYPFDSSKELRGIFNIDANGKLYSVGDTCKSNGSGARWYGYYNMGDMAWSSYSANYGKCYYGFPPSSKVAWKGLSDDYKQANVGYDSLNDREFTTASGTREAMFVRDDRYPTVESFAAAVKGKYVMYELASPVATESAIPIPNPQSCDVSGTEEFVDAKVESGERAISIPVCCTTTYLAGINSDTSTLHVVDEDTETLYVFD